MGLGLLDRGLEGAPVRCHRGDGGHGRSCELGGDAAGVGEPIAVEVGEGFSDVPEVPFDGWLFGGFGFLEGVVHGALEVVHVVEHALVGGLVKNAVEVDGAEGAGYATTGGGVVEPVGDGLHGCLGVGQVREARARTVAGVGVVDGAHGCPAEWVGTAPIDGQGQARQTGEEPSVALRELSALGCCGIGVAAAPIEGLHFVFVGGPIPREVVQRLAVGPSRCFAVGCGLLFWVFSDADQGQPIRLWVVEIAHELELGDTDFAPIGVGASEGFDDLEAIGSAGALELDRLEGAVVRIEFELADALFATPYAQFAYALVGDEEVPSVVLVGKADDDSSARNPCSVGDAHGEPRTDQVTGLRVPCGLRVAIHHAERLRIVPAVDGRHGQGSRCGFQQVDGCCFLRRRRSAMLRWLLGGGFI